MFPFPAKQITVYNIREKVTVYEVLTVMNIITTAVLWDVTTCNLQLDIHRLKKTAVFPV